MKSAKEEQEINFYKIEEQECIFDGCNVYKVDNDEIFKVEKNGLSFLIYQDVRDIWLRKDEIFGANNPYYALIKFLNRREE